MSDETKQTREIIKRTQYTVDARAQLRLALPLLAVLVVVAIAYVVAIYLLPGRTALETLSVEETRSLFLRANTIYYCVALVGLAGVSIFITQRVVGPAQVIERAVRGMQAGDYDKRLNLRPGDSLQSLAASVAELREGLREQAEQRRSLAEQIAAHLDSNDLGAARNLVAQLEKPEDRS